VRVVATVCLLIVAAWPLIGSLRRARPLEQRAARVRWCGAAICVSLIAAVYLIFKAMGKQFVHEHVTLIVVSCGIPIFTFLFFVFLPGFSTWLSQQVDARP
jgi:hypothetical protein